MKRFVFLLAFAVFAAPVIFAQENDNAVQIGAFGDYLNVSQTSTNLGGLGARLGIKVFGPVKLEAEMSYDFSQVFTESFSQPGTGVVGIEATRMRVLHGEFGPRFEFGHGRIRPFVFAKGGIINFGFSNRAPSFDGFISSVQNLRYANVNGVLYPGGGVEAHLGPVGLRLDVGDEVYFNGSAHNGIRVAFGPFFQF
jgi:hypothetical protein